MNNFYEFLKYASSRLDDLEQLNKGMVKSALRPPNPGRWGKRLKHGGTGAALTAPVVWSGTYLANSSNTEALENRNRALETENKNLQDTVKNYNAQPDMNNMNFMDRLAFLVFGKNYTKYMGNIYRS